MGRYWQVSELQQLTGNTVLHSPESWIFPLFMLDLDFPEHLMYSQNMDFFVFSWAQLNY